MSLDVFADQVLEARQIALKCATSVTAGRPTGNGMYARMDTLEAASAFEAWLLRDLPGTTKPTDETDVML